MLRDITLAVDDAFVFSLISNRNYKHLFEIEKNILISKEVYILYILYETWLQINSLDYLPLLKSAAFEKQIYLNSD